LEGGTAEGRPRGEIAKKRRGWLDQNKEIARDVKPRTEALQKRSAREQDDSIAILTREEGAEKGGSKRGSVKPQVGIRR